MRIYIGSDHAGFELKGALSAFLREQGHEVEDMGPHSLDPEDDYPDYCLPVAKKVAENKGFFGVVIGGSGQGEAIVCNRVSGARAALYYGGSLDIVRLSREHNDANILSLGARFLLPDDAKEAARIFLETPFSNEERHARRIEKIDHV